MLYGWVGRILTVNLTEERVETEETMRYAGQFIGGRGVAARIAWEKIPLNIDAYDPGNHLIFMTGPLTGTLAPTSGGRMEVCGLAPQTYPKPCYTRSSMGGYWAAELKYAGYDGVVFHGKAEKPVYLWVEDGRAELRDAGKLWGLDTFATQKALVETHGRGVRVVCIGPAGENLVRIAVIQSELENAAGQGGFGAVMGSKNLKAIAVRGSGGVNVAEPEAFLEACRYVKRLTHTYALHRAEADPDPKCKACTMSCTVKGCGYQVYRDVPGKLYPRSYTGAVHCVAGAFAQCVPWEAGFEAAQLSNLLGVNHWELIMGFGQWGKWLKNLKDAGLITQEEIGVPLEYPVEFDSGEFWSKIIHKIAYREGIGRVLAEGLPRAVDILGKGKEFSTHVAHGFATHWDGHIFGAPRFPHWIVSALTWAMDSRDSNVHGYAQEITYWWNDGKGAVTMEQVEKVARRVYGSEKAVSLESGYEYKVQPTIWHENNDCVKDSLLTCDQVFPVLYSRQGEDGYGDVEADAVLFTAATGIKATGAELNRVGERVFNLERAIAVREGRTRRDDETVIPYFKKPDYQGIPMDEVKFLTLMDEFYALRGWDVKTGIPTRLKLEELNLGFAADELGRIGKLP